MFDFGCYGANLMTWLMDNQRPRSVTAITRQFQPDVYPRVDDEATILLEYPKAQGIIQQAVVKVDTACEAQSNRPQRLRDTEKT